MSLYPFSVEYENEGKLFHSTNDSSKSEVAISANVKIRPKAENWENQTWIKRRIGIIAYTGETRMTRQDEREKRKYTK